MDTSQHMDNNSGNDERRVWKLLARTDPSSPTLLYLGQKYLDKGEPERALKVAKRVISAHQYHLKASLLAARALVDLDRPEQALAVLKGETNILDILGGVLGEMAEILDRAGDHLAARRAGEAARALLGPEADLKLSVQETDGSDHDSDDQSKIKKIRNLERLQAAAKKRRLKVESGQV